MRNLKTFVAVALAICVSSTVSAQPDGKQLTVVRATTPIVLDGHLDEAAWANAPIAKDFIQNDPREGEPATFDTEVKVLYDGEALYFGVFAKDDEPGKIIVNELRKDFNTGAGDGFQIVIDTFYDRRNGYQFAVNPGGARWDAQMSNEGRESNSNWDGIWDVGTRIEENGWYAEIRIPFRTLKFTAEPPSRSRRGVSTSSGGFAGSTRTATGRRCPESISSPACRWLARSMAFRACVLAQISG
jgi:hypothetical protein